MKNIFNKEDIIHLDGEVYCMGDGKGEWYINCFGKLSPTRTEGLDYHRPIVAATNPSLEGVPLFELPDKSEEDFENWLKLIPDVISKQLSDFALEHTYPVKGVLRNLYKAASKKEFTEEDVLRMLRSMQQNAMHHALPETIVKEYLQSLRPKLVYIEFEVEEGEDYLSGMAGSNEIWDKYPSKFKLKDNKLIVKEIRYE